jgi:hypothetical protein
MNRLWVELMADADEKSEAKPETSDANEEELLMRLSSAEAWRRSGSTS